MKKSPLVLSIIGAIATIASAVLLIFLPQIGGELNGFMTMDGFKHNLLSGFLPAFKGTMLFGVGQPVFSGIFLGLFCLVIVFWLWHFIMLCATRRANSLSINLFWLIFGFADVCVFLAYTGYSQPDTGYVFVGQFNGVDFTNAFSLMGLLFADGFFQHLASILVLIGILALAGAGFILSLISVIGAIHDDRTDPNYKEDEEEEEETSSEEKQDETETSKVEEVKKEDVKDQSKQTGPLIIQNITYGASAPMTFTPAPAPQQAPSEEKKEKPLTEDDVRRILIDALTSSQKAIQAENKEEEKAVAPAPTPIKIKEKKEVTPIEERPLTAKELRSIIKNELRDHDHPEELLPLTDEQCRALIRDELDEYYASTRPQNEKAEEEKVEEKVPETTNDNFEEDFMTADELSKMIRNEVVSVLAEKPAEEKLTLDMVRNAIKEELASQEKPVIPTKEEIVASVKEELAPNEENEKKQNELILSIKEQAFKAEYEAKLEAAKNEAAIERIKNSQLTADDIRSILASELDKRLANLEAKKEEPKEVEAPKVEEPIAAPAPKDEVIVPNKEESEEEKAERLPFATRLLNLDDDMKEFYNELKEEALSYGLKSRLSISGDTFRLHTKTYLKIVVAGKGLKLYMALDPHDYKDSTIPVKDAGVKNLYKDIPLVFKVKSPLSLKRAKSLIKDVCEKDNLKKEEITHFNYVAQLTSYKVAGTEEEDE